MAPSTSVNQLPQVDASAAIHNNGNGNGALKQEKSPFMKTTAFPRPQKFDDPYQERQYLKERLALGFRIFAKNGFDAGVAGHITVRV